MELQFAATALWRDKLVLAIGIVAAVAAGVLFASRSAAGNAGFVATVRLVLDTPKSQLLEAAPSAADSLPWRAQMLADLMKSKEITDQLAKGMGVPATDVDIVNPSLVDPPVAASIPAAASKSAE